jgi:hypothetical protein
MLKFVLLLSNFKISTTKKVSSPLFILENKHVLDLHLCLQFVYTAEAPAALVSTFSQLVFGPTSPEAAPPASPRSSGPLPQAIENVMGGERILWVTCTGKGASGGLAVLCGLASALYFPGTSVDVITFATPWQGFNPQFAWSFNNLISLYYFWPFDPAQTLTLPATPIDLSGVEELDAELKRVADGCKFFSNYQSYPKCVFVVL